MNLVEFYTTILNMVDIQVENGFLKQKSQNELIDLTRRKGMNIVLPVKELMDNMYVLNKNNKFTQKYLLFNPLSERLTTDNIGLEILSDFIKVDFGIALLKLGEATLRVYMEPKLQSDLPMIINTFIEEAKDSSVPGMKTTGKAVDETSIRNWIKLITSYMRSLDKELFTLVIPRTKNVTDKSSFTREARLMCNLLSDIKEVDGAETNVKVNDVTLRPKDVKVFQDILEIFMVDKNDKGLIVVGSNDEEAPGLLALMGLFYKVAGNYSLCLDSMKNVDKMDIEDIIVDFKLSIDDINKAPKTYKKELALIPSESELNLGTDVANSKKGINLNTNNLHPVVKEAVESSKEKYEEIKPLETAPMSAMDMLLNKGNNVFGLNQPVMNPQMMPNYQQPMQQQLLPQVNPLEVNQQPKSTFISRLNPRFNSMAGNIQLENERKQIMVQNGQMSSQFQPPIQSMVPVMQNQMQSMGPVYGQPQMGPGYMNQPMMQYNQPMNNMSMYQPQYPNMGMNVGYVPNNPYR